MFKLTNVNIIISISVIGFLFFLAISGKLEYKKHGDNTEVMLSVDVNKK